MNWKKKIPLIMAIVGVLSFIGAILLLVLAVPKADATYKRVLEVIISCLMIILSLLIAYYLYVIRDAEPNFFLFDRAKKKNIPVENLNFTIVNERMSFFLTMASVCPENCLIFGLPSGRVPRLILAIHLFSATWKTEPSPFFFLVSFIVFCFLSDFEKPFWKPNEKSSHPLKPTQKTIKTL